MRTETTPKRVRIYCTCGHYAVVTVPRGMLRDDILPRARCSVCGLRGAVDLTLVVDQRPGWVKARDE